MIRSNKFQTLSDKQILKRYRDKPQGEALHFLTIEIETRGLQEQAEQGLKTAKKASRHSPLYYLFYLFLFGMFLFRFGAGLF